MAKEVELIHFKLMNFFMNLIGRPVSGKIGLHFISIVLLFIMVLLQVMIRQFLPWKSINNRILALESTNVIYFNLYCLIELAIFPEHVFNLIGVLEKPIYKDRLPLSDNQKAIRKLEIEKENNIYKRFLYMCLAYAIMNGIFPFIVGIIQINTQDIENMLDEDIRKPIECWQPFSIRTNLNYILATIPQILCRLLCLPVACNWCYVMLGTMKCVSKELKLVTGYITEMDERIGSSPDEHTLKVFLSKIVDHHVEIIRCVEKINKNSKVMMLGFNQIIGYEFCVAIYCITEVNDVELKTRFSVVLFTTFIVLLNFSACGQEIVDEADILRQAIENSSWIDKPESYKKLLRILLIGAHRPLEIKPAGLYVLNLIQVMKVAKASFSYLNLMQSIKNK